MFWPTIRRSILDRIAAMTRVLPAVGFGRTAGPPTDPVHRDNVVTRPPDALGPAHEQHHVHPTDDQEHGHPRS